MQGHKLFNQKGEHHQHYKDFAQALHSYSDAELIEAYVDPQLVRGVTLHEARGCDKCNDTTLKEINRVTFVE